jgi:hypothetical protein
MNRRDDYPTTREQIETALYFPYIRVPRTPWFTQVLLYWDQAASIVPGELRYGADRLDPSMRELNAAGLLEFIDPNNALYNAGVDRHKLRCRFHCTTGQRGTAAPARVADVYREKLWR